MSENLKCNICSELATVHLTQVINNKVHKIDLCETCANEKGITDPEGFSLTEILTSGYLGNDKVVSDKTCKNCGFKTSDLKKLGRLGCPECYQTMSDNIYPVLKDLHKGTTHVGKVPSRIFNVITKNKRLNELKTLLNEAVKSECYEDAAMHRDEIEHLNTNSEI